MSGCQTASRDALAGEEALEEGGGDVALWKSGSLRMRLCSGMVVLMPSITYSSRARRMRAMDSCRSRPCVMTLAIIES